MFPLRRILFQAVAVILFGVSLNAQEQSIYQDYYLHPFLINPAFTGMFNYPVAELSAKKQWLGIPDSPSTFTLSGNYRIGTYDFYDPKGLLNTGPLELKNRMGLGLAFVHDRNGPLGYSGGVLSYAYHFPVKQGTEMSLGMAFTGSYFTFDEGTLRPVQPDDALLYSDNRNQFRYNFNLGTSIHSTTYYIGLSVLKILHDRSENNNEVGFASSFYLTGGYKFNIGKQLILEPAATVKKVYTEPVSVDLFSKLYYKRFNWISLSYGSSGKLSCMLGIRLYDHLYAGYVFEYSLSSIARYNFASHQISIGLNLGLFSATVL